jgi:hypothetical protein
MPGARVLSDLQNNQGEDTVHSSPFSPNERHETRLDVCTAFVKHTPVGLHIASKCVQYRTSDACWARREEGKVMPRYSHPAVLQDIQCPGLANRSSIPNDFGANETEELRR